MSNHERERIGMPAGWPLVLAALVTFPTLTITAAFAIGYISFEPALLNMLAVGVITYAAK